MGCATQIHAFLSLTLYPKGTSKQGVHDGDPTLTVFG